jgi:hypothetical protein
MVSRYAHPQQLLACSRCRSPRLTPIYATSLRPVPIESYLSRGSNFEHASLTMVGGRFEGVAELLGIDRRAVVPGHNAAHLLNTCTSLSWTLFLPQFLS